MNGSILDTRSRPRVQGVLTGQRTVHGKLIGRRRPTSARVGIVDERGVVRVAAAARLPDLKHTIDLRRHRR